MMSRAAGFMVRALPWLLAAGYLSLIGALGWHFDHIEPWRIDKVDEVLPGGDRLERSLSVIRPSQTRGGGVSRFILEFPTPVADMQLVLFLPRAGSDVGVKVNGARLRSPAVTHDARHDYLPLWIPLPRDRLQPSGMGNTLEMELISHTGVDLLSRFHLGPADELAPVYRSFQFFRQSFPRIALGVTLILGIFMLTIWGVRPRLREYGWLGLAFLAFSYYLYSFIRTTEPDDFTFYTWSFLLARATFVWAFVMFMHRFLGVERKWIEHALGAFFALVFLAGLWFVVHADYGGLMRLTLVTSLPMVLLMIGYICLTFGRRLLVTGHVYLHWLCVGGLAGLVLGIYDVLVLLDVQHWLVTDFFVSHYAIVFSTVGAGGVLVHRVARALLDSEDLNAELNRQLAVRTRELESAAQARLEQEKRLALYAERQRIMADMHDGVGGQLTSLMAANRSGRLDRRSIGLELDRIFADLRLVLDALTPAGEDLVLALARLRDRYQRLLEHAGIRLGWRVDEAVDTLPMPPEATVNVLRLVQEAIQNTIRHSGAARIDLFVEHRAGRPVIGIADDGRGYDTATADAGKGLESMRRRARDLEADLDIDSRPGSGTCISLVLPPGPMPQASPSTHE